MGNARAGRLVLLGAAACMLAAVPGVAGAHAAPASRTAAPVSVGVQGYDRIGTGPVAGGPVTQLLGAPDGTTAPSQYAQTTFDAWVRADEAELRKRGTSGVADMLTARPWSWDDEWEEDNDCEGAAGSTYCTWTGRSAQLTLRVASERAANGRPHAVTEAALEPVPGSAVALWPLTTQEQADNSQRLVDMGHSPWLLYPDNVATLYVEAELGWNSPRASAAGNNAFRVTDPATGARIEVGVGQPARTGDTGIWAVTSLRSTGG